MKKHILLIIFLITTYAIGNENIEDKINATHNQILEIEVSLHLGMDSKLYLDEILRLQSNIKKYENMINTSKYSASQWSESELLILDAKNQIDKIMKMIRIQGDWGKISLRPNEAKYYQEVDLKYKYGF